MGKMRARRVPIFNVLDFDRFPPSVANLSAALTINNQTVYPTFRYNGKDANATNWPAWGYGETLTITGASTAPTYNNGSPLQGSLDGSVKFNGIGSETISSQGFVSTETTNGNVGTNDYVFECVFCGSTTAVNLAAGYIWCKRAAAAPYNILQLYRTGTNFRIQSYLGDGVAGVAILSGEHTLIAYHHVLFFVDRSGSAQYYINGVTSGAPTVVSAVAGAVTNAVSGLVGAYNTTGAYGYDGNIAYLAMWQSANWLDTHLQATVAKTRFAQLTGVYPSQARGTALPSVMARTTAAYLDKIESDGTTKLYYVGANWPRICSRLNGNSSAVVRGYLSETAAENKCLQSQTFATTWTAAYASVPTTAVVCPDGVTRTTCTLHESADAGQSHTIYQTVATTATLTFSVYAKAVNRTWLRLGLWAGAVSAYYNLATGVLGTLNLAGGTAGIESCGNGWYRCWMRAVHNSAVAVIYVASADNTSTFNGLDQDSLYIFGAQIETGNYPSTYIPTTTAAVTRTPDSLRYVMNDGNLTSGKGSLVVDFMGPNIDQAGYPFYITVSDGGANNRIILLSNNTTDEASVLVDSGGTAQAAINGTTDIWNGNKHTIRATWKTNQARQYVDGAVDGTEDTSCAIPVNLSQLDVGAYLSAGYECNGLLSNLRILPKPSKSD